MSENIIGSSIDDSIVLLQTNHVPENDRTEFKEKLSSLLKSKYTGENESSQEKLNEQKDSVKLGFYTIIKNFYALKGMQNYKNVKQKNIIIMEILDVLVMAMNLNKTMLEDLTQVSQLIEILSKVYEDDQNDYSKIPKVIKNYANTDAKKESFDLIKSLTKNKSFDIEIDLLSNILSTYCQIINFANLRKKELRKDDSKGVAEEIKELVRFIIEDNEVENTEILDVLKDIENIVKNSPERFKVVRDNCSILSNPNRTDSVRTICDNIRVLSDKTKRENEENSKATNQKEQDNSKSPNKKDKPSFKNPLDVLNFLRGNPSDKDIAKESNIIKKILKNATPAIISAVFAALITRGITLYTLPQETSSQNGSDFKEGYDLNKLPYPITIPCYASSYINDQIPGGMVTLRTYPSGEDAYVVDSNYNVLDLDEVQFQLEILDGIKTKFTEDYTSNNGITYYAGDLVTIRDNSKFTDDDGTIKVALENGDYVPYEALEACILEQQGMNKFQMYLQYMSLPQDLENCIDVQKFTFLMSYNDETTGFARKEGDSIYGILVVRDGDIYVRTWVYGETEDAIICDIPIINFDTSNLKFYTSPGNFKDIYGESANYTAPQDTVVYEDPACLKPIVLMKVDTTVEIGLYKQENGDLSFTAIVDGIMLGYLDPVTVDYNLTLMLEEANKNLDEYYSTKYNSDSKYNVLIVPKEIPNSKLRLWLLQMFGKELEKPLPETQGKRFEGTIIEITGEETEDQITERAKIITEITGKPVGIKIQMSSKNSDMTQQINLIRTIEEEYSEYLHLGILLTGPKFTTEKTTTKTDENGNKEYMLTPEGLKEIEIENQEYKDKLEEINKCIKECQQETGMVTYYYIPNNSTLKAADLVTENIVVKADVDKSNQYTDKTNQMATDVKNVGKKCMLINGDIMAVPGDILREACRALDESVMITFDTISTDSYVQ